MKRVYLWLVGLFIVGFAVQGIAAPCQTVGGTKIFDFPYVKNITNPNQNVIGTSAYEQNWNTPGNTYSATCSCSSNQKLMMHYKAVSTLPNKVPSSTPTPDPSKSWYVIPNDKGEGYLGVSTKVYIAGKRKDYFSVPFTMDNNNSTDTLCPRTQTASNRITLGTGAQGKISLMFIKPFIGHVVIPRVKIIDLFAATDNNSFSSTPIASVYVSGDVTVPQSCQINDGKAIEVPFGKIDAKDILTKGQIPSGFTKKQITVNFKCTNIASGVKLALSMEADTPASLTNTIKTSNNDIGVMVADQGNRPFIPHVTQMPVTISAPNSHNSSQPQQGTSTLYAWPVNITGNYPQRGPFSATASLNINLQ